ncbi:hypothetical protein [Arsenicicoccus dermatophilus]|uniref:hypothetical protein n=1 Tax=Arsenicicoccus dermatophilus TaxID=1076331 RepID=UPI001F4CDF10|nr:hypothetical protein [Arsenicicoccus dermatophilus]MCH8614358.1 hypothetical protein [Arsenicicoccus dermatophilus]
MDTARIQKRLQRDLDTLSAVVDDPSTSTAQRRAFASRISHTRWALRRFPSGPNARSRADDE